MQIETYIGTTEIQIFYPQQMALYWCNQCWWILASVKTKMHSCHPRTTDKKVLQLLVQDLVHD